MKERYNDFKYDHPIMYFGCAYGAVLLLVFIVISVSEWLG